MQKRSGSVAPVARVSRTNRADARSLGRAAPEELDALVAQVHDVVKQLPSMLGGGDEARRAAWTREVALGRAPEGGPAIPPPRSTRVAFRALDRARTLARSAEAGELYLARLEEMELEIALIETLGDAKRVRPVALRRFGSGADAMELYGRKTTLGAVARALLKAPAPVPETHVVPAVGDAAVTLERIVRHVAKRASLDVDVKVVKGLVAGAAAGDHTVFLSDRTFGKREALRLAVHEVEGHLVAAANAFAQPFALLAFGTHGSHEDQEGLALALEEAYGLLDTERLRHLAGRVVASDAVHAGVRFGDAALALVRDHGFAPSAAVSIAERAYRGGGIARDVIYLRGWLRVRQALDAKETTVDELRIGRVSLASLPEIRRLRRLGLVRAPRHIPSLARNLASTFFGTSFETSPPSLVTSLHKFDAT